LFSVPRFQEPTPRAHVRVLLLQDSLYILIHSKWRQPGGREWGWSWQSTVSTLEPSSFALRKRGVVGPPTGLSAVWCVKLWLDLTFFFFWYEWICQIIKPCHNCIVMNSIFTNIFHLSLLGAGFDFKEYLLNLRKISY